MKKIFGFALALFFLVNSVSAQTAEVTISLNEQFFDTLLDAVFTNLKTPAFPISQTKEDPGSSDAAFGSYENDSSRFQRASFGLNQAVVPVAGQCDETIRLLRATNGVRTAVKFRNAQIAAPIAFAGSYNPPLVGCLNFEGLADSNIVLEFDRESQILYGRARVSNVNLNGTGGFGGGLIGRMVQSSIDNKINPIKILDLGQLSFVVPVENSGSLRMRATDLRYTIGEGVLHVHITYQFLKGN